MYPRGIIGLLLTSCALLLFACAQTTPSAVATLAPTVVTTLAEAESPVAPPPTASRPAPSATATTAPSTESAPPTATPTPTPLPEIRIAVPPAWEAQVAGALAPIAENAWSWTVLTTEAPGEQLAAGVVDLAVVPGEEGALAGRRPLAVAVPFSTPWEDTTLSHALQMQRDGHSLVQVLPWDELQPHLRPLRVDGLHPLEPEYPLQQTYVVESAEGFDSAARYLAERLTALEGQSDALELVAVGDIMLDRTLGRAINNGKLAYPFANVAHLFHAADIVAGNLECSLGDIGEPAPKSYTFQAPPAAARSLAEGGFDVLTLANNHALDYGPDALLQGLELLQAEGIATVGAGANAAGARAPAIIERNGQKLAFLGYVNVPVEGRPPYFDTSTWTATAGSPGLAWAIPAEISADVAAAKAEADHVIVLLHHGLEYVPPPSPEQQEAARAAIDAGAALVIGHHAHILQGVEFYNGGVIVYGLANFAFTIDGPPETAILRAWFDSRGIRQIEFVPAVVQVGGQPRLADPVEAATIRDIIYSRSNGLSLSP